MSEIIKTNSLQGGVTLVLMSRQGQSLVHGRPSQTIRGNDQSPIIGLLKFAAMTRVIWLGATYDDPYADWWLVRLDHVLRDSQQKLREESERLDEVFSKVPSGISVDLAESACPMRLPLKFSCPYGFIGAYLLGDYDHFVRRVLTARHIGAMTRDEAEQAIAQCGRHVRRAYMGAAGYRCMGVARSDVRGRTVRGEEARARMGEVPGDILDGASRPEHMPLRRSPAATMDTEPPMLLKVAEEAPVKDYVVPPASTVSVGSAEEAT